jgi:internalin A
VHPSTQRKTKPVLKFGQEPGPKPEYFVSYAWADRTPKGREREAIVDKLCTAAERRGITILRDKKVLGLGDRISKFMIRLGRGDRIFVVLSEKYLKSPYCMFELFEVWRNCREEGDELLSRIRVHTLTDAKIWTPKDRAVCALYWREQSSELKPLAEHLGDKDHARYRLMNKFAHQVGDVLENLADIVQPRTFDELEKYGFQDDPAGDANDLV